MSKLEEMELQIHDAVKEREQRVRTERDLQNRVDKLEHAERELEARLTTLTKQGQNENNKLLQEVQNMRVGIQKEKENATNERNKLKKEIGINLQSS